MPQVLDFSPIDPLVQEQTLTYDFALPSGITFTGIPSAQISVVYGIDSTPASRIIGGPVYDSTNRKIVLKLGNCVAGVRYLIEVYGTRTDGDVSSAWNHISCIAPA